MRTRSLLGHNCAWPKSWKLDVEAGAVPERIHIKSKRDDEGDNVILPTIDLTVNPFVDLEEAEKLSEAV